MTAQVITKTKANPETNSVSGGAFVPMPFIRPRVVLRRFQGDRTYTGGEVIETAGTRNATALETARKLRELRDYNANVWRCKCGAYWENESYAQGHC